MGLTRTSKHYNFNTVKLEMATAGRTSIRQFSKDTRMQHLYVCVYERGGERHYYAIEKALATMSAASCYIRTVQST